MTTGPRVVLIGPMGAGKSTVGAILARRWGVALRDTVLDRRTRDADWIARLHNCRGKCGEMASEYFRARLFGLPRIVELVEQLRDPR